MNLQLLKELCHRFNIFLSENVYDEFALYAKYLQEANSQMNLTALSEPDEVALKHFFDSLLCLKLDLDYANKNLLDLGTGAGFPGLVLKLACRESSWTLVDSLKKRVDFLELIKCNFELSKLSLVHARAEDLGQNVNYRQNFDYVFARAVARLPILCELCLPLLKKEGRFIALKGPDAENEVAESANALKILNGKVESIDTFSLPEYSFVRKIVVIKKTGDSDSKYPRRAGIIQKRPLL